MGALLALMLTRTDLGVVAVIGIILLIGIVMKNAIMMIDFALEAERRDGKPAHEAIYQACLLRFRPILMTTLAALLGALPLALGGGVGRGAAPPAGHRHRRRPDRESAADALHHAGDLPCVRSAGAASRSHRERKPPARRRWARSSLEHLRALHSSSGRHDAADRRTGAGRSDRLSALAGRAAAAGGFPHDQRVGGPAGRKSRDHGHRGGDPARASARPHRRASPR